MNGNMDLIFGDELFGEFMIDLDYEFEAPKFFDLSKEEQTMDAMLAEKWFDTAKSDRPHPNVKRVSVELDFFLKGSDSEYTSEEYFSNNGCNSSNKEEEMEEKDTEKGENKNDDVDGCTHNYDYNYYYGYNDGDDDDIDDEDGDEDEDDGDDVGGGG